MTRRYIYIAGGESQADEYFDGNNAKVQNGTYTVGISSASPKHGSYHIRASSTSPPSGTGAYYSLFSNGSFMGSSLSSLLHSTDQNGFEMWFSYQTNQVVTANNLMYNIRIGGLFTPTFIRMGCSTAGGVRRWELTVTGATQAVVYSGMAASTKYWIRCKAFKRDATRTFVLCEVYSDGGVLLGRQSVAVLSDISDLYRLDIGLIPQINSSVFTEGAQDHDIDSLVITKITTWDEPDVLIGGTVSGPYRPNGIGNQDNWTGVGDVTNKHLNVDEVAIDDTDYNFFQGSLNLEQSHDIPSYSGSNVPDKVCAVFRHAQYTVGGINDVFFKVGFDNGSGTPFDEEGFIAAANNTTKHSARVAQNYNGTAFTTSNFANLEVEIRKTLDLPGNDKILYWVSVEVLEDDGFMPEPDLSSHYLMSAS